MLTDIPYNELKKDKRAYEIMLLRDQYGNSFSDIASVYEISGNCARKIYHKIKNKQVHLYARHIALALGHTNTARMMREVSLVDEFYWDIAYVCTYLEKTYYEILLDYRQGEPGMPRQSMRTLPPFRKRLSKNTIQKVVTMRENEGASFQKIARECKLTQPKARRVYEMFYHDKTLKIIEEMERKLKTCKEKMELEHDCFDNALNAKERYEMVVKEVVPKWNRRGLTGKK